MMSNLYLYIFSVSSVYSATAPGVALPPALKDKDVRMPRAQDAQERPCSRPWYSHNHY